MADETDGSSGTTSRTADLIGEHETSVFAEFVDAVWLAAESMLEEQRQQVAQKVSGIAEALRNAANSLEQSQNRALAGYVDQAADQVASIYRTVRERHWNEIVADTEDFARRQPTLFVLGAVATGFLVGRFLWAGGRHRRGDAEASRSETTRQVIAAVSSGSGIDAGGAVDHGAGSSGVMEDR